MEFPIYMESKKQGISVTVRIGEEGLQTAIGHKWGLIRTWNDMRRKGDGQSDSWKPLDEVRVLRKAGWEEV